MGVAALYQGRLNGHKLVRWESEVNGTEADVDSNVESWSVWCHLRSSQKAGQRNSQ